MAAGQEEEQIVDATAVDQMAERNRRAGDS